MKLHGRLGYLNSSVGFDSEILYINSLFQILKLSKSTFIIKNVIVL